MKIIVKDIENNKKYVLIGSGYGAYRPTDSGFFGDNLIPHDEEGNVVPTVAVCDNSGEIMWIESSKLKVVEIDDIAIEKIAL